MVHRCGKGEEVHGVVKMTRRQASVGAVRFQRSMVGDGGAGLQSELYDEAAGVGGTVGEQASEGVRFALIALPGCGESRQEADNPPGPWPSLIRCCSGHAEDIRDSCRAVPGPCVEQRLKATQPSCQAGHAFFGLTTANRRAYAEYTHIDIGYLQSVESTLLRTTALIPQLENRETSLEPAV